MVYNFAKVFRKKMLIRQQQVSNLAFHEATYFSTNNDAYKPRIDFDKMLLNIENVTKPKNVNI